MQSAVITFSVFFSLAINYINAQPGTLDLGFDLDGKLITDLGGVFDNCGAVARFYPDGSPDISFDMDGKVTTDFDSGEDHVSSMLVQPDGKILVSGSYNDCIANTDFSIARYNVDGSLDISFNKDGKVTTDFAGGRDYSTSIALQPDGKIIIAGDSDQGGTSGIDYDIALARYFSGLNNNRIDVPFLKDLSLFPDPVITSAVLEFTLTKEEILSVDIADMNGRIVKTVMYRQPWQAGTHRQEISFRESFSPGSYLMVISNDTGFQTIKFIKL